MVNNTDQSLKKSASSSGNAKTMAELMAKSGSDLQILQKGQAVTGIIKKLTPGEILMDIGAKGDALVIEFDRQNIENLMAMLKVGDKVTATVISPESEEGFPVLSLRRMLDDSIFSKFQNFINNDESFEVRISEATRGGYFVETNEGIRGFLPSSQVTSTEDLSGQKIQVKILEVDRSKKRVVFSQKAITYLMNIDEIRKLLKSGEKVDANIVNITPYGLFVTIEAKDKKIEGFIHISEVSYDHVDSLSTNYKVGDKIAAVVVEVDSVNRRVNLSIKRTLKDSFLEIESKYKVEDKVKGTVSEVRSRGITLSIEEGISGFIPSEKVPSGKTYKAGDTIEATVTGFDKRRRLVLVSPILTAVPVGYR